MKEKSTEINTQKHKGTKENAGWKRKPDPAENILSLSENIEKRVTESEAKMAPLVFLLHYKICSLSWRLCEKELITSTERY